MQESNINKKEIYNSIIKNVSSFPALSTVVGEVCSVCQNQNSTIPDLVKVIEKDPGIMIDILRIANSPIYGFTREISSIHQAISLFGMGTIKGFVISSVVRKNVKFNLEPYGITINSYLDTCREFNRFLIEIFKSADSKLKEVIFPASFLMASGILMLANEAAKLENNTEFMNSIKESNSFIEIEDQYLGVNSISVTAILFEHWNFESALINAIKGINQEEQNGFSAPLKLALKCISLHKKYTKEQEMDAKAYIEQSGLKIDLAVFDNFINKQNNLA
ncbi:MAG: HDOD domain-containing protein [Helicobacteraceae bacterium]|nr:HDOD domain-containing protein [Helicobacteraceae bacterium]